MTRTVEINAALAAEAFARALKAQGGPQLDEAALDVLRSTMIVYLTACLAELGVGAEQGDGVH